jgi:hypothetical protein
MSGGAYGIYQHLFRELPARDAFPETNGPRDP